MATKARISAGVVMELLTADPFPDFYPTLIWVDCTSTVQEGWIYDGANFFPSLPSVITIPREITPLQTRLALNKAGLLSQVTSLVAAASVDIQQSWEYASYVRRDNPILLQMAVQMRLTSAQIDQLFLSASSFT